MRKRVHSCVATMLLFGFLVGCYRGRIAVWKDDDPEPCRVFPCLVSILPKKDREALYKGIRIEDMDDVNQFLINFLS